MRECYQLLENPTVLPYNKLFKATEEVFEANNIDVLDSSRFYLRRNLEEKHVDFIKCNNIIRLYYYTFIRKIIMWKSLFQNNLHKSFEKKSSVLRRSLINLSPLKIL